MTIQVIETDYGTSRLECDCERTAIRHRTQSNGVKIYALQCLDYGRQIRAVSKNSPEVMEMPNRVPFDDELQRQWRERQAAFYDEQRQQRENDRTKQDAEWWRRYDAYLLTPAWRLKRQAVMTRANNWCEGCACRPATQVHHTTYAHVFDELLFQLVAVCDVCHRKLHPDMDER